MAKSLTKAQESTWGMAAHMSAVVGLLFPLGLILGPLAVWLFKRNESAFVDANGKEAINFQVTVLAAAFVIVILSAALKFLTVFALLLWLAGVGLAVYAGLQAKKGENFKYPIAFRFLK